jgi:hypothetical protein
MAYRPNPGQNPTWWALLVDEAGPGGHCSDQRGSACVGPRPGRPRRHGRRPPRGDLRCAGCRRASIEPGSCAAPRPVAGGDRHRPPPQRAPTRRRATRPGADLGPDHRSRLPGERPQRQRQADRRSPVVASRLDPPRYHHDHRVARRAQVAPARNDRPRRRKPDLKRPKNLAIALTVAVHAQRATRGLACTVAPGATSRACLLDLRRSQ